MKLFLSGPMTGLPEFNYPEFRATAAYLRKHYPGDTIVCPTEHPPETLSAALDWVGYMKLAIAKLLECDSIVMLDGWSSSPGAKVEWELARRLGYAIYYKSDLIPGGTDNDSV